MLRTITWQQFGLFTLSGVALYYCAIGLIFFRKNITRQLAKPKEGAPSFLQLSETMDSGERTDAQMELSEKSAGGSRPARQEPDLYPIANELVEAIDEFISQAGKKEMVKEEVVFGLRQLVGQYPMLRLTGFKVAINNYIGIALKNHCAFLLDEQETASLWAK